MTEDILDYIIGDEVLPLTADAIKRMDKRVGLKVIASKRAVYLAWAVERLCKREGEVK